MPQRSISLFVDEPELGEKWAGRANVHMIVRTLGIALALGLFGVTAAMAQGTPARRTPIILLSFVNKTGDPQARYWKFAIDRIVGHQLNAVRALRLLDGENSAMNLLKITEGAPISLQQKRRIGAMVEAQRLISGEFQRTRDAWRLTARVLNVNTGTASQELILENADLVEACRALSYRLLSEMHVIPTPEQRSEIDLPVTQSATALELAAKALAIQDKGGSMLEVRKLLTDAVHVDPRFIWAYLGLAATFGAEQKFEEARAALQKANEIAPKDAHVHSTLGVLTMVQGQIDEANRELMEAKRLDPDEEETEERLGELALLRNDLDAGITHFREALRLSPLTASAHAHLGSALAYRGDSVGAVAELKEAGRIAPNDINTLQMLFIGYDTLKDAPKAADAGVRFMEAARKSGTRIPDDLVAHISYLKGTLTPTYLSAPLPKTYTPTELQRALRSRLTPTELQKLEYPLEEAPGMSAWAKQLTQGTHTEIDSARAIFNALLKRPVGSASGSMRTAKQVYALWKRPDETFNCQEYAKLYVVLARAVGLKAFMVHLERDFENNVVYHDCAAVFVDRKAVLVDLAYLWFGPNHREHVILDDVQAIAHLMFQSDGRANASERAQIASKLHPGLAWGQVAYATSLLANDRWAEAEKVLAVADHLEPNRWDSLQKRGVIAARKQKFESALVLLKQSRAINPNEPYTCYYIGKIYRALGNSQAALEALRACVRLSPPESIGDEARQWIVELTP